MKTALQFIPIGIVAMIFTFAIICYANCSKGTVSQLNNMSKPVVLIGHGNDNVNGYVHCYATLRGHDGKIKTFSGDIAYSLQNNNMGDTIVK